MSIDIVTVFTALRKFLEPVCVYSLIKEMGLEGRDGYLAMKSYGCPTWQGLDYDRADEILGKECVDEWLAIGTFADSSDAIRYENLDHWCDPEARQKYYEEHLSKQSGLRRTASMRIKLHQNFTIAEIEHAMRNK